jgi:nucleoside-diphosphate-sugar epimerase
MRVFVTGATGLIGSYLIPELIGAGHQVIGLTRSRAGAETVARAEAEPLRGNLSDLEGLRLAAGAADGVIHRGLRRSRRLPITLSADTAQNQSE